MAALLAMRWAVLAGSVHLLFDVNDAEYGFFRVAMPAEGQSYWQLLTEPAARLRFLHNCRTVGNQVHGTLGLAGYLLVGAMRLFGLPYATLTLKKLALGVAAAGLVGWMVGLLRTTRRPFAAIAFALLYAVCPIVLVKLNLLYWGTHELVIALHAGMIAGFAPWLDRPSGALRSTARLGLLGAVGGLATLANYSLLLPVGGMAGWMLAGATVHAIRAHTWRAALMVPAFVGSVGGAWALSMHLVLRTRWLEGLGYQSRLPTHSFMFLSGKKGNSFLMPGRGSALDPQAWVDQVLPGALRMAPGPGYGANWQLLEGGIRVGLVALAVGAVLGLLVRERGPGDGLTAFLGTYLVAGFIGVSAVALGFGLVPGGVVGVHPRYYAHLYPVAFALVAMWSTRGLRRWPPATTPHRVPRRMLAVAGLAPVFVMVWAGAWDNAELIDLPNRAAAQRYDGVRIWLAEKRDRAPSPEATALGGASPAFIAGMAMLQRTQFKSYWKWYRPMDLRGVVFGPLVERHAAEHSALQADPEFWRGVGYGLRVLVPPSRAADIAPVFERWAEHAPDLQAGYDTAPGQLQSPPR